MPPPRSAPWLRACANAPGLAAGVAYRTYRGHLSGIDALPVAGGFFTHPDRIVSARKFPSLQKLDFRHEAGASEATRSRDTLFLDQAIESAVGAARAQTIRRRTVEYVNALSAASSTNRITRRDGSRRGTGPGRRWIRR